MQLDSGRLAFYRINRGAGYAGYDTYIRLRGTYDTVQSALEHFLATEEDCRWCT
jgi:hypothetical protein